MRKENLNRRRVRAICRSRLRSHELLEQRMLLAAWDLNEMVPSGGGVVSLTSGLGMTDVWKNNHSGAALFDDVSGNHFLLVPANNDDNGDQNNPGLKVYPLSSTYAATSTASAFIDLDGFQDVESIISLGNGYFAITEEKRWDITVFNFPSLPTNVLTKSSLPADAYTVHMQTAPGGTTLDSGNNHGIEGLAYDPAATYGAANGTFYAVEEYVDGGSYTPRIWSVAAPAPRGPLDPALVNRPAQPFL